MSFQPIQAGIGESLLGTGDPVKLLDISRQSEERSVTGGIHGTASSSSPLGYTIGLIFMSAFIFVGVVAIFEVFRSIIIRHYADLALTDPRSNNTQQDIIRTEIANQEAIYSSLFFALVAVVAGIIFVTFIAFLLSRK